MDLRAVVGLPRYAMVQAKTGAGDEGRTRDVLLGKEVLYH
jgi:hypothetical protein